MSNVVDMSDHRPHLMLVGQNGNVHVIPVELIQNLALGTVDFHEIDPELVRDIFADWLTQVQDA